MTTIEIDGVRPDAERLLSVLSGFGHFTAMQIRDRRTRGLDLHVTRLDAANRETFGEGIDADRVRDLIRHALGGITEASVRVYVYEAGEHPVTMVTVKPPAEISSPQRLRSVRYQRPLAHIKQVTTDQGHHRRVAQRAGADDALLVTDDDRVSETTMTNIGFFDGSDVIWPDAPMLRGITMQLLDRVLTEAGAKPRQQVVRPADVVTFDGAFLSNARGVAVVLALDEVALPLPEAPMRRLAASYASVPWDRI